MTRDIGGTLVDVYHESGAHQRGRQSGSVGLSAVVTCVHPAECLHRRVVAVEHQRQCGMASFCADAQNALAVRMPVPPRSCTHRMTETELSAIERNVAHRPVV